MTRARAYVDRAGALLGNDAPGVTKLPTPRKQLIELCAAQYGLRFEERADSKHPWALVDGEQWLASRRQAVEAGFQPRPSRERPSRRRRSTTQPLNNAGSGRGPLTASALLSERGGPSTSRSSSDFVQVRPRARLPGLRDDGCVRRGDPGPGGRTGGGVVRLAQAPAPTLSRSPAPSRETIPLVSEMRDAEGMRARSRPSSPGARTGLDSGELARFYGSALGQGRRIAKATILAQAEHFDLVVRDKTASGFTLATTLNRTARWALVSEAEEAARPARAPVEGLRRHASSPRRPPPRVDIPSRRRARGTEELAIRATYGRTLYVTPTRLDRREFGAPRGPARHPRGVERREPKLNRRHDWRVTRNAATDSMVRARAPLLEIASAAGIDHSGPPTAAAAADHHLGQSVHLPGFAPARFRSNSPLHDDAAALRERSAADDRAEAGLE